MGQSGILEADKLMFADNPSSPEKIEVVMGRCFPMSGPGGDYDVISIPVVRKIVYKNRDGATYTQTFSEVISSENDNHRMPVSTLQQQGEYDKQGCRQKTPSFVKHEASDGTRSDAMIMPAPRSRTQEVVNRQRREDTISTKSKHSSHEDQQHSKPKTLPIDANEMKRISAANSPRFRARNKTESPKAPELSGREAWEETQKKKAQLRDEFFRVPYEECNQDAIRGGMGGRLNKSEPKLNSVAKDRKKRNSLSYKRRVHFNMDDSHLEDIRKWREERRMQATPPCIKTVARIYSLDAPSSNQRQIEYVSAFDSPKAEVPVAISLQDSPSVRTKVARPTDLDSLQIRFAAGENPTNKRSATCLKPKSDSVVDSRGSCEKTSSDLKGRLTTRDAESADAFKAKEGIGKVTTSSYPYPSHPMHKNQNQSTILRSPHRPDSRSSSLSSPSTSSCARSSDIRPIPQQLPEQNTQTSLKDQPQNRTRPTSPHKSLDFVQQSAVQKQFVAPIQTQPTPTPRYSYPTSANTDISYQVQQQNQKQQENQRQQCVTAQPQDNGVSNISVRPRDFHPHVLNPVPLQRSKSLRARRDAFLERTSESQYPIDTSVRSKTYDSRRATSLDRALTSKRTAGLLMDSSYVLKSPGLILNHLRSPTATSPTHKIPYPTPVKTSQTSPSQNITQTSQKSPSVYQNSRPVTSRPEPAHFDSTNTPLSNTNVQQNPVNIIRSYTYPKRNSVTLLQKPSQQSNDYTAFTPTIPKDVGQDYHKKQTQHPRFLDDDNSNFLNSCPNKTKSLFNNETLLQKPSQTSNANSAFTPTIPNDVRQDYHKNQTQHPRFLDTNSKFPSSCPDKTKSLFNNETLLQKPAQTSNDNSAFPPTIPKDVGQDYHKNQTQHPRFLDTNSNFPNSCPDKTKSPFNNETLLQKPAQTSNDNSAFTPTIPKDVGQDYHKNQTQHPRFLDNNSNFPNSCPNKTKARFNNDTSQSFNNTSTTNTNRRAIHKPSNKENEEKTWSQKTSINDRGDSVKILMTKGESFSKHRIVLNSHMKSMAPRVTVKKIIVPASSSTAHVRSTPVRSAPVRSAPSPTPSCASSSCSFGSSGSSSGCFSGSPSPTPTPSPTRVRASGVPTDL